MTSMWLRDLVSLALQIAVIVVTAAAFSRMWRFADSRVALGYWRALLLACLLLPFCQPWTSPSQPPAASIQRAAVEPAPASRTVPVEAPPPAPTRWPSSKVVLLCTAVGIAGRGVWLALGALGLARLRRGASPLDPVPEVIRSAQQRIGATAAFCTSEQVAGPITFGLFRPVILLPPNVLAMSPRVLEAIAHHELLHVRRRDWIHEIVEEGIRTIFWFHPAVWWLIGRIRLTREQVVDRAAICLTDSRDGYLEALLTVALSRSPAALAPAPLFLRRSLLKRRVAHILQETTMSTRRFIAAFSVSFVALVAAAVVAVQWFPLRLEAHAPQSSGAPVEIVKGGEQLLHGELPEYPDRAIKHRVEGDVTLELSLDDRGEVMDARVLSGPDDLRRAALEAALRWHYSPDALRSTSTQAVLRFRLPAEGEGYRMADGKKKFDYDHPLMLEGEHAAFLVEQSPAQRAERMMMEVEKALENPATTDEQREELKHKYVEAKTMLAKIHGEREHGIAESGAPSRLTQIRAERVPQSIVNQIVAESGLKVGDVITEAAAKRIVEIAQSIDEHMRVAFHGDGKGGTVIALINP